MGGGGGEFQKNFKKVFCPLPDHLAKNSRLRNSLRRFTFTTRIFTTEQILRRRKTHDGMDVTQSFLRRKKFTFVKEFRKIKKIWGGEASFQKKF